MMAVATTPSFGLALPTAQLVPALTIALPDPGLAAITSPAAEVRMMERSSFPSAVQNTVISKNAIPTTISTVTRPVPTTTIQLHTTDGPKPQYSGAGKLLSSACTHTDYTLVDAGRSLYYAPFIGCINKKIGCCPFAPGPTTTGTFPQPLNQEDALLDHCPSDYYSVSGGGCCPSGYTPWTATLGGQTPCFSSSQARRTSEDHASRSSRLAADRPTVVISDAVFAMNLATREESDRGLSGGAVAGIVIGVLGCLLLAAGLAYMFVRHRARNPRAIDLTSEKGGEDSSYQQTPIPALSKDKPGTTTAPGRMSERSNPRRSMSIRSGRLISPPPIYQPTPLTAERLRDLAPLTLQTNHRRSRDDGMSQKLDDHDDADELCMLDSGTSTPLHEENAVIHEVQLARPERLSRGYARIIYTHQGSASSTQTDGKSIRSNLDENK
ncbi:hypothetical protein V8F06_010507 [Rhypophila decipiens]